VLADNQYVVCRLVGIDAPERDSTDRHGFAKPSQPLSQAATEYLAYLLREGVVHIALHGKDVYKRHLCAIENAQGSVNAEMVRAGFAEVYRGPGENPFRKELETFEQEARAAKRGIWRLADYQSPRAFRRSPAHGVEIAR
jgi:endonuclease YncB( thermonuclease family)